jgi:acetylornithine deacetylase/succinyl-diaminopimelate desuccinylase-like protein
MGLARCISLSALMIFTAHSGTLAAQEAASLRPDQVKYRALLQEMVETDTSVTTGSCTALTGKIAQHFRDAGFAEGQITEFSVPDHPKEGGLVVIYPGTSKAVKPLLLLGHIDVVAAKREDWTRDPYKLIEENGYFFGRGVADMKSIDAIWVDALLRMKADRYKPKRTIKLALTCGEETTWAFNGAQWLAQNKPDLIAAEFALNEGGGGDTDGHGKLLAQSVQVGEKAVQNFRIEATNPGGHSSTPVPDNAIYELANALVRIAGHEFPLELNDTTRAYFTKTGAARKDAMGAAMLAIVKNPQDKEAEKTLNTDRGYHSMLRTTCVATLLDGGHANNALPQRAGANINCRILPGHSADEMQATLTKVIDDPKVTIAKVPPIRPLASPPPMDPKIIGPMEALSKRHFPGVPVVPAMATGATDGIFLEAIGIPTYGVPGPWYDPDGNGMHGLNERIEVRGVYQGRDYLFDLIKAYAG